MCVSLVALTGFIFILVFANSLTMLVIGQVLCGFPWGVFVSESKGRAPRAPLEEAKLVTDFPANSHYGLCQRSLPYPAAWLPHSMGQSLLGSRNFACQCS